MNKFLMAASASALLFALASTSIAQDAPTEAAAEVAEAPVEVDVNQVVAKGDGFKIYVGDVLALMSELPAEYQQQNPAELYPEIVNQLVSQEILSNEADEDSDEYKFKLRQAKRAIAVNAILTDHIETSLNDEYLQATYDDVIGSTPAEEGMSASHILLKTEEEAAEVIKMLDEGADFAELAKEKSTGPSAPNGGDLGWFGKGQMVAEFETATQALEKGAYSKEPVQTEFGFHVIMLNDCCEKPKPTLEEVGPQLEQFASQRLMDEKVQAARDSVEVEIIEGINPAILQADFN